MARKKSNDSAGALGFILLAALATLITFASAIYGLVALVAWNFYSRKFKRLPKAFSDGYFIATRAESRNIVELEKSLADERKSLAGLVSEGRGSSRRSDGEFDERSTLGKHLNREISGSRASETSMVIELSELKNYSYQRRLHFTSIKVNAISWSNAGFAYVAAVIIFLVATPEWVAGLNQFLNKSGWLGQIKSIPMLWEALAAAAFVSLAIQQVTRLYCRYSVTRRFALAEKPDKHIAVRFTELLAAQSKIGLYERSDLDRAEAIFKEREASKQAANPVVEQQPDLKIADAQEIKNTLPLAESPSLGMGISTSTKTATVAPLRVKRALWKRMATASIFGLIGFISGLIIFGTSGQGNFGVALVLILPLVGLAWGFNFRKFSQKVKS